MKKISTVFKKDPNNLALVINEVNPENHWVLDGEGIATRKWDGTACAVIDGELYKRYDVKKGKSVPECAIPCQEPDEITGHWPHWVKCNRSNPGDKYHWEAFDSVDKYGDGHRTDGTYELCGPKINGGKEKFSHHWLVPHGYHSYLTLSRTFESIHDFLGKNDIEGIVFHHPDGRMAKIRKSDFGIKR
jgi:hypothetical protein